MARGAIVQAAPPPERNHLLGALPAAARERLFAALEPVRLPLGKVIYEVGDRPKHAYFPVDSIVSLLYVMENGDSAEIAVAGRDGVVGMPLLMGGGNATSRALVQSAGWAYRMPASRARKEFENHSEFQQLLLRYMQALITQMAQTAVCNRHHTINQQFARWLLMALDRLPDNVVRMTQELIANMLGVRREGVTQAAGRLQRLGVIQYRRGQITVLDRGALEGESCECYRVVRDETQRLLFDSRADDVRRVASVR